MAFSGQWKKVLSTLCAALLFTVATAPVHAGLVGTDEVLAEARMEENRAELLQMLERDEVRQKLEAMGVEPADAEQRVERMTEAELAQLQTRMDEVPAGGDALGVALAVFIVFIVTDVIGATDVFPFVDPVD